MARGEHLKGRKLGGRKKGAVNKTTASVKQALLIAFERAGGVEYLVKVAKTDPKTFCTLLGRVIPTEIAGSLALRDERTPEQIRAAITAKAEALGIVIDQPA